MNTPVFTDRRRSKYDQRMSVLRYCISIALYGPQNQWPQYTLIG